MSAGGNMKTLTDLPTENTPIRFTDDNGVTHEGTYIASEKMFFIGYEESGDFRFNFEITKWEYILNNN